MSDYNPKLDGKPDFSIRKKKHYHPIGDKYIDFEKSYNESYQECIESIQKLRSKQR